MIRDILERVDASFWTVTGRTPTKQQHCFPPKDRLSEKSHLRGTLGLEGAAFDLVAKANALIHFSLESALRRAPGQCNGHRKPAKTLALEMSNDGGLPQVAIQGLLRA